MGLGAGLVVEGQRGRDPRKSLEHCLKGTAERVVFSNGADLSPPKKRVQNIKKVNFGKRLSGKWEIPRGGTPFPWSTCFSNLQGKH